MLTYETTVECLDEFMPPEGNASAIDDETDAAMLDWIYSELRRGNCWAWCCVRVKVTAYDENGEQVAYGDDYVGGCSYESEAAFRASDYFVDMCEIAREECDKEIERLRRALA